MSQDAEMVEPTPQRVNASMGTLTVRLTCALPQLRAGHATYNLTTVESWRLSQAIGDARLLSLDVRIRTQVSEYERLALTFSRLTV